MQHRDFSLLQISSVAAALVFAATLASAAGPRQAPGSEKKVIPEYAKVLKKKLITTSVQGDSDHYNLASGFTEIGTQIKFTCTKACMVTVNAIVQVQSTSPYWAICPRIDGLDAVNGCNWQGIASSPTSAYVTGNGTYFWSLSPGQHTFQAEVYLSVAGGLDNWATIVAQYE